MTINEAINSVDTLKHNTFEKSQKIAWLSELDWTVKKEILDTHEGEVPDFAGYAADQPGDTELLVPMPYAAMYQRWLEAKIDYHNGEFGKYNNAMALFDVLYQAYAAFYTRNYMPKSKGSFKGA